MVFLAQSPSTVKTLRQKQSRITGVDSSHASDFGLPQRCRGIHVWLFFKYSNIQAET